jgi:hypothetical protein
VVLALVHVARWLAWQIADPQAADPERPASITVFSG